MDTLIIQTGVKHGRVAELTRSRGGKLSVGRGFDNDLVLTDAYVAPRQIEFQRDGTHWRMTVLDHTNPVFLNDRKLEEQAPRISEGDTVTVGRTRLTVHSSEHPVESTRKLLLANWLGRDSGNPVTPVLFLVAAALLDLGLTWAESATDLKWGDLIYGQLWAVVIVLLWAGIWALVGRVARHQHHFGLQLITAACTMFLASVFALGAEYLAFPFHHPHVTEAFNWTATFLLLAALFHVNLMIATNLLHIRAVAATMSALVVVVLFGFFWFSESDDAARTLTPTYSTTLVPPLTGVRLGSDADAYFARVAEQAEAPRDPD